METPKQVASRLAKTALRFSPAEFEATFRDALARTADIDVQSRLLFTAGMFLDRHSGAFLLPRDLTERLLASADLDQLIGGLKAIEHCGASTREIIASCLAVMQRADWEQREVGLNRLNNQLGARPEIADEATINSEEFRSTIAQIADTAPADEMRKTARHCLAQLVRKSPD